jgi:hypothetical protein
MQDATSNTATQAIFDIQYAMSLFDSAADDKNNLDLTKRVFSLCRQHRKNTNKI